ncbi:hypothetical protein RchiOBHm_Chr2g0123291 [Rosa chinensis]|uniref:Uncharacterized protein n=1 Tax=Rosa chinensis TaxID=74649 RepID=A0A2P6RSZ8_ROSCH|nr:hypothetical protein RchiOBHm_Chr2g0123291 [Rosa chinensis]
MQFFSKLLNSLCFFSLFSMHFRMYYRRQLDPALMVALTTVYRVDNFVLLSETPFCSNFA